jgi:hypothetical protein
MSSLPHDAINALTGQKTQHPRPRSITPPGGGGKFSPDGQALTFPGNTILCHIDPRSRAHEALIVFQQHAKNAPWASSFSFLPPSSFHMTVFEGVCMNEAYRSDWPEGVSVQASRDEVSAILLDRLRGVQLPERHLVRPMGIRHKAGIGVVVEGADEAQDASLRAMRILLRDTLGIYPADFAGYRFHITLAYMLHWLTDDVARQVSADLDRFLTAFRQEIRQIELGPPEFCNFETMRAFTPLRILRGSPQWASAPE